MSTAAELVRKLILAHAKGDDGAFRAAAESYIADERRKNHHVLARDLERLLANLSPTSPSNNSLALLNIAPNDLPHDKDRGAALVEVSEPERRLDDLVLTASVREQLERIVLEQRRAEELRAYGLRPSGKVLFCGPPGCGKTIAAEAVAQALYLPLVLVRFDAVISSYLGETAANLFERPDIAAIIAVLQRNTRQIGLAPGVLLAERARDLLGASHADIERVAQDAVKQTILDGRTHIQPEAFDRAVQRYLVRAALTTSAERRRAGRFRADRPKRIQQRVRVRA